MYSENDISKWNGQDNIISIEFIHMFRYCEFYVWSKNQSDCITKNKLNQTVHNLQQNKTRYKKQKTNELDSILLRKCIKKKE